MNAHTLDDDLGWRGDPAALVVPRVDAAHLAAEVVARLARRPVWHDHAACRGENLQTFFPARGESAARAKTICAGCAVIDPCLDEALEDPDLDHGVRGGMTAGERQALRTRGAHR